MSLDKGRVVDVNGEVHQGSLRSTAAAKKSFNIDKSMLGVVLRVYPADMSRNLMSQYFGDRHSFVAVCEVLVMNDGSGSHMRLPNVMIPASNPGGLDNFSESLPRGSSKYINGEDFDVTNQQNDTHDLDGDWCVINFIGGNIQTPFVTNWWPHPRNTFDPQTSGEGHPNSKGEGQALQQCKNGRGRSFRRINGVETVVSERGDIFLSTHYSNSDITPNAEGKPERGRFSRSVDPNNGGGIRVNVKTSQAMELNWAVQEDGIGLNSTHDPSLPQTNPQQTRPYSARSKESLFIKFQNKSAIFETPSLFFVDSSNQIRLNSGSDTYQSIGGSRVTTVGGIMDTIVDGDVLLVVSSGNIATTVDLGNITNTVTAGTVTDTIFGDITTVSQEGNIDVTAELGSYSVTALIGNVTLTSQLGLMNLTSGGAMALTSSALTLASGSISFATTDTVPTAPTIAFSPNAASQPPLLGATWQAEFALLATLWATFIAAVGAEASLSPATATAASALTAGLTDFTSAFPSMLSTQVTME